MSQVRFGDFILMYGTQNHKVEGSKEISVVKGLMTSQGFGQDSVYLENLQMNLADDTDQQVCLIKNYKDCVFQIWPKLDFEAHKEFKKLNKNKSLLDKLKAQESDQEGEEETIKQQEQYYSDIVDKIRKVRARCATEKAHNYNQIDQARGKVVMYGTEIFLMHLDSAQFLNGQVSCSESDQSAYRFELSMIFNRGMGFKVVPKYKLRQEGEPIQYKDNILLHNIKLNCYVNFSTQVPISLDRKLPTTPKPYYNNIDVKRNEGRQRYECFVSSITEATWQLLFFRSLPDKESYTILGHDLVYLKHTETQGYLSSDYQYKADGTVAECYVRLYEGQEEDEKLSLYSIWEVEVPSNSSRGEELVLSTKATNLKTGKVELEPNMFILRHFFTGKILVCEELTINGKKKIVPCLLNDDSTVMTHTHLVQFISTAGEEKEMMENNICYLLAMKDQQISVDTQITYSCTTDQKQQKISDQSAKFSKFSQVPEDQIYQPLRENEVESTRYSVFCEERGTQEENAFQLQRVEMSYQNELFSIASQVSILNRFSNMVKTKQQDVRTNKDLVKKVQNALTFLIFFVGKSSLAPSAENALLSEGVPIPNRQRLLRDFRIIEILTDILYYMFKYEIIILEELGGVEEEIIRIFQLSYKCIMASIKDYAPNELYASQWLNLMILQAKMTNNDGDIGAEETLTELIDNNKLILETKITEATLFQFMDMLLIEREKKYVEMVYALCVCSTQPMIFNQSGVSEILYQNKRFLDALVMPFTILNSEIMITPYANESAIRLLDFKEVSEKRDQLKTYNFFLAMLSLHAGLCLGRNYIALDCLEVLYPLEICYNVISKQEYDDCLRRKMARLVMHLWIDRSPYSKVVLPDRIRVWKEIDKMDDQTIPSTIQNFTKLQPFKTFILEELIIHSSAGFCRIYEKFQNELLLEMLNLMIMMMEFGFYINPEELEQLIVPILLLAESVFDVSNQQEEQHILSQLKEQEDRKLMKGKKKSKSHNKPTRLIARYEESDVNLIVHQTKRTLCDALNFILKLRTSTRISYMLLQFKLESQEMEKAAQNKKQPNMIKSIKILKDEVGQTQDAIDYAIKPQLWIEQLFLKNKISFKNKVSPLQSEQVDILSLVLLDLNLYQNNELVNVSFEFLISQFTQRISLVNQIKEVQLLEEEPQVQAFKQLQSISISLSEMVEKSEQWMWKPKDHKHGSQGLKVLELLNKVASIQIDSNKQSQLYPDEPDGEIMPTDRRLKIADENKVAQLVGDGETINSFAQDLMRNTQIYVYVLNLLKFDVDQFNFKRQSGSTLFNSNQNITHRVLRACYLVLARFVHLCPENQSLLQPYVDKIFIKHLKYLPDIDLHLMMEPLLYDNKAILLDEEVMASFLKDIARTINSMPNTSILKPAYFRCLISLTKFHGKVIKNNQTMIINEITHRDYNAIILTYNDDMVMFDKEVNDLKRLTEQGSSMAVQVPAKLDYFNGFVVLMGMICEEKNNATESKAQNYFPLSTLQKLIEIAAKCWYVRKNLMYFFYHVYLDTEREMTEDLQIIKKNMIMKLKDDLEEITQTLTTNRVQLMTFHGIMTMKQIKEEYYFGALLLCVETIIKKRMIDDFTMREEFHQTLINSLITIIDTCDPKYRQIIKNMLSLLVSVNAVTEQKLRERIIILECIPSGNLIKQAKSGQVTLYSFIKVNRESSVSIREQKLKIRMDIILSRQEFQNDIRLEMNKLIISISSIEEYTLKAFKGACTIPFNEILTAMIDFTKQNAHKDVVLTIQRLQIFRRIIELKNLNQNCKKSIGEWENDDWDSFKVQVTRQQNLMVELGMVKMLYQIMMQDMQSPELLAETIHLSIALLLGGNPMAQEAFYQEMISDTTNSLLIQMKERLERSFEIIKKSMSLFNKRLFDRLCSGSGGTQDKNELLDIEDQELEGNEENTAMIEDESIAETIEADDKQLMNELIRLIRVLQLFCEGHNLTMQNYLRQQVIENQVLGRNYDFIHNASLQFSFLVKYLNVYCVAVGNQLMDFIIESVQGPCEGNQQKLVGAKIIDSCKDLITKFKVQGDYEQFGFSKEEQQIDVRAFVTKSNKLLVSLIEGKGDPYVLSQMAQTLDIDTLLERLKDQYQYFKQRYSIPPREQDIDTIIEKVADRYDQPMMETYQIFILIKELEKHSQYLKERLEELDSPDCDENEMMEAVNFFKKTNQSIEIQFNDNLITVNFPVQPICRLLSENTRRRLMTEIPRESANEKIEGLTDEAEGVFDEMNHMAYLKSNAFNFSQSRLNGLRDTSTLISFAINFMMILTYHKEVNANDSTEQINMEERFDLPTKVIMNYLGYAQLITSSLMLLFWVFIHSPLLLTIKWRIFLAANQKEHQEELYSLEKYVDNEDIDADDLPLSLTIKLLYLKGPQIPLFNRGLLKNFGHPYTLLMYFWKNFIFIFSDGNVKYFFFYITVSFIGKFVSEIAYSLHLLDIIERFPTLQNVIKAITTNSTQLLLTSLLGVILMYIWAIIGFYFLDDNFQLDVYGIDGQKFTENVCTSLLQCFIVVVDQGLILGGGIGDFLAPQSFDPDNAARYYVRYIYDLLFFMVVKMAFLNIIFGIIIDTFADLRDKRNKMEEDMKNVCFICGLERDVFDQFADGFENHIERDHNLWNYLYFLYHLKITPPTDYNGIESYIADKVVNSQQYLFCLQIRANDSSWFPMLKARSIEEDEVEDEEAKVNVELESIKTAIHDAVLQIDRLTKQV